MHSENLRYVAGGEVDECALLLRFSGPHLEPDLVSTLLGVPPTEAYRKGDRFKGSMVLSKGLWLLDCERTTDCVDHQVQLLFGDLTDDLVAWHKLAIDYLAELRCALFLRTWNRATILSAETIGQIAARNLRLHLDIYMALNQPECADKS